MNSTNITHTKKFLATNRTYLLLILLLTFIQYSHVLNAEFVQADDLNSIVNNPTILNFRENLKTLYISKIYQSSLVNLFGISSTAFHVSSVIIHGLNSFLLFLITKKLFNKNIAFIAAILFTTHPANSEAVSWISGAEYLFYGFFAFSTLFLYLNFRNTSSRKFYIASILIYLFYAVLMKRPWGVTIPFLIIVIEQFVLNESISTKIKAYKHYFPYLVISLASLAFMVFSSVGISSSDDRVWKITELNYYQNVEGLGVINLWLLTIERAVVLLTFPAKLSLFFDNPVIDTGFYLRIGFILIALTALLIQSFRKDKKVTGFILAIFIAILPTFSPIDIGAHTAERYFYLSTAFFCIMISYLGLKFYKKFPSIALFVIPIVFFGLFLRTYIRTLDWKTDKSLWIATQKVAKNDFRVYNNLGNVYFVEKEYLLAYENYVKSVELNPDYSRAVYNLGLLHLETGNIPEGKRLLLISYEMNSVNIDAYYWLGVAEQAEGNYDQAKIYYEKAIELNPGSLEARQALEKIQILE